MKNRQNKGKVKANVLAFKKGDYVYSYSPYVWAKIMRIDKKYALVQSATGSLYPVEVSKLKMYTGLKS